MDQDRELVAAQAGDHVLRAHRGHDALGHLHQQLVAGGVADAVVDQLEPVQVQEQHREGHAVAQLRALDRAGHAVEQVGAVGQPGEGVVQGLVGEALLGAHALADLGDQLLVGRLQFGGALDHAPLQFCVRRAQALLRTLAGQAIADVVGDEGQQALVVRGEADVSGVALHRDHPHHLAVAMQRHAQPAEGLVAVFVDVVTARQRVDPVAVGEHRLAGAQHVLGQAVAEPAGRPVVALLVDRVDELDRFLVLAEQGDVEVARVDQLVHRRMDLGVVLLQRLGAHRHLGDAEQRVLQALGALALDHLLLQFAVGVLQLHGAFAHAALQFHLRLAAVDGGEHVLGDVAQQRTVRVGIAGRAVVALHHDRAADPAAALHRHAKPVLAVGALDLAVRDLQLAPDQVRGTAQRAPVPQQGEGQAVGHVQLGPFLLGIGLVFVGLVGEVEEAHRLPFLVVGHDVAVGRVHQRTDDRVQAMQQLAHLDFGAGQFGDLVQRLLQQPRLLQRVHPRLRAGGFQRRTEQGPGGGQPAVAGGLVHLFRQPRHHQRQARVLGIGPGQRQQARFGAQRTGLGQGQLQPPRGAGLEDGFDQEMVAEHRVAPGHGQLRAFGQERVQRRCRPFERRARASRQRCRRRALDCDCWTHASPNHDPTSPA